MSKIFYIIIAITYSTFTAICGIIALTQVLENFDTFILWICTTASACSASIAWLGVWIKSNPPSDNKNETDQ